MNKIIDGIAVFFLVALTLFSLVVKIVQEGMGVQIYGSEHLLVNLVFMFSCVAGIITWRDDKHLSLSSLSDNASDFVQSIVHPVRAFITTCVLTVLFFVALSGNMYAFMPEEKVIGIPLQALFAIYPLMFFAMLFMAIRQNAKNAKNGKGLSILIASIAGVLIGLFISSGPISGVLYFLFKLDDNALPFLYRINEMWLSFTQVKACVFVLIILLVLCALIGVPLFIVISAVSYVAFSYAGGYVDVIPLEAYRVLTDKNNASIPLFTITGYLLSSGSAGTRIVDFFKATFGWFRGGIVVAVVLVVTFFTTFTGVSGITILALGSLLTIVLSNTGYSKQNAQSLITASGAIGLLFPPSVAIIMFASINYFSVDVFDLFKGAIIPGILLALGMIILGIAKDKTKERPAFSMSAILGALKTGYLELLMPIVLIVLYAFGNFTLVQVAAFSVVYAYVLETVIRKDFSFAKSITHLAKGIAIAGGVLTVMGAAGSLAYYLQDAYVPYTVADFIQKYIKSPYVFLLLLNFALLIVGCLMDIYSAIMVVSPIAMVIAESYGIPPVHTAVIFLMNMQLGFLTPPVGMDLFIASYAFDTPVLKIVKSILPFLLVQALILLLVTYVPWFTQALF